MRAWLWQRVPDYCRTPGHMKRAYYDVMRREAFLRMLKHSLWKEGAK